MDIQKKKMIYRVRFFIFMAVNIGVLWFYLQSEHQYRTGEPGVWQLLPYFWFVLTILWAVLVFHYQKLNLKSQNTDVLTGGFNERAFRIAVEKRMKECGGGEAFVVADIKKLRTGMIMQREIRC